MRELKNTMYMVIQLVFFDGGYEVIFGKKAKESFIDAIESCMERKRADLNGDLILRWIGNNSIKIELTIKSNENYEGILKIYVVEPISRWNDYEGKPYHFGFLGYAANEEIFLNEEELKKKVIWNATQYGYEITKDNIMAIAVVFSKEEETKYSDPPQNTHPFEAHFVDLCLAAYPLEDNPPLLQLTKKPSAIHGYRNVSFEWTGSDDYGEVLFSYKLEGYEEDWHDWSYVTHVKYNLTDGEYEFILKGKDNIGQISQISYKFVVDTSPPKIIEHYPKNNQKNVPIDAVIKIKFSHEMDKKSVEEGLKISPAISYEIKWIDNQIIIYPLQLNYETVYTVKIENAYRKSGQKLETFSFSFETAKKDITPPYILYVKPFNEELYDDIEIKFSEPMDKIVGNAIEIEPWIQYKYEWKENDTLLIIHLREYLLGSYTVKINEYMTDKSGNALKENYTFSFYITKPTIVYTSIENGEKNVPTNATIEIEFSHKMNKLSIEDAIQFYPECYYVISWKDDYTIIINASLKEGEEYYLNITGNAKDIRGIEMGKEFSLRFKTYEWNLKEIKEKEMPSFIFITLVIAILFALKKKR